MKPAAHAQLIKDLQEDILRLEGFKSLSHAAMDIGLGPMKNAFPNASFPLGAVHEFLSSEKEDTASSNGFIAALLSSMMGDHGATLWISAARTLFPPALKNFGLQPDHFIFIDLQKEKDVLWAMEEALKCSALSAVVGEVREIDFTASRRLQLAVEQSQVTGFVVRQQSRKLTTTACVSRWRITSLPSSVIETMNGELPGIGFPKWKVELLRMRNGKPGVWNVQWRDRKFEFVDDDSSVIQPQRKQASNFIPSYDSLTSLKRKTG